MEIFSNLQQLLNYYDPLLGYALLEISLIMQRWNTAAA